MNLTSSLNLVSQTTLERDQLKKLKTILNLLTQHVDAAQFRQPVDWQALNLNDYLQIIKKPMDIGTVNNKLKGNQYQWLQQVLDDIQMVWDNCKQYNQAGSWIYVQADKMEKYFRKLVKNYFTGIPIPTTRSAPLQKVEAKVSVKRNVVKPQPLPSASKIANQDESSGRSLSKKKIISKLKQLRPQQLGQIIELILEICPEACNKVEDNYQICIPQIQEELWEEIKEKLEEFQENEEQMSSKRVKE